MDLGAEPGPDGTSFRTASPAAQAIDVCLFDDTGRESDRIPMVADGAGRWEASVRGVEPGQRYGYRVTGPADRAAGHAADPAKLLVDPAARLLDGDVVWHRDLWRPGVDSAPFVPRSVVVAPATATRCATPRPWDDTFVYEAHVGHLTARHPEVPPGHRGRYPGLGAPAVIDHLRELGVTAVELLPVQHFASEPDLVAARARNVWGYNPLAWGAPHRGYATDGGDPAVELRAAVAALHDAGIEVWLDVVFNHTAEGALATGPTLSWRGLDNASAYRLHRRRGRLVDQDLSGCGNTVDTRTPWVRDLIVQVLVRWVREFGIDGFRFDLAAALVRTDGPHGPDRPDPGAPLLAELAGADGLDGAKLVGEPWDLGEGGYALDRFPPPWRVWNDRFRDDVRRHWIVGGSWSALAPRLAGSGDVFDRTVHDATVGIDAVVTHDGRTLADLVDDPAVRRAMLATVLVAQGVPMVSSGDELGRTQGGERDGYRLEPERWGLDWDGPGRGTADDLVEWLGAAVRAWHRLPALRRARWVEPGDDAIAWRDPSGAPMAPEAWEDEATAGLAMGCAPPRPGDREVLVLFARPGPVTFALPPGRWQPVIDSRDRAPVPPDAPWSQGAVTVEGPAVVALAGTADPPPG